MFLPDPRITRRLVDLAAPIVGLNVLNVLALAIDTAMCGRLPDADRVLTALGFATQLVFLLMVAMMGLVVGAVSLVSRAHGSGDADRVNLVLAQAVLLTTLLGALVAGPGNLVAGPAMALMGATEPVVQEALLYLRPLLLGTVCQYLGMLFAAVLRGVGNTRLPFLVALVASGINVLANYGLILGNLGLPALGLQGAAIGTVLSQTFSAAALVVVLRSGVVPGVTLPLWPGRPRLDLIRELVRVGAPAAFDMVIVNAAFLSIVGMLGRIDQIAVAAHGMGLRVQSLAFVPGMSVSQATGAMVGQALGRGSVTEAKQVLRSSVWCATGIMGTLALLIVFFAGPIVNLFDIRSGTLLYDYSVLCMEILGYGMPAVGVYIAFVGLLHGAGTTQTSLRINIVVTLLFQIPVAALLGFGLDLGVGGVWACLPLGGALKAFLGWRAYRAERWAVVGATA